MNLSKCEPQSGSGKITWYSEAAGLRRMWSRGAPPEGATKLEVKVVIAQKAEGDIHVTNPRSRVFNFGGWCDAIVFNSLHNVALGLRKKIMRTR